MTNRLLIGHALEELRKLESGSVHLCCTSPPYWGLRKYGDDNEVWGGEPGCRHEWGAEKIISTGRRDADRRNQPNVFISGEYRDTQSGGATSASSGQFCSRCGAWRGQLGLEPTPELYVAHLVEIFREVRRVLRDDGTVFLNLGDSYASGKGSCYNPGGGSSSLGQGRKAEGVHPLDRGNKSTLERSGLKPKDLVGIPWRVAFALQADGWYLRSDVIWNKPNPMPESVTDRPTRAHEYIFLLTKSARYYYDADAVRENHTESTLTRVEYGLKHRHPSNIGVGIPPVDTDRMGERFANPAGRNLRSVWTFATQPYPEAHFATFPLELPMRCIRTSPPKVCAKCGAGWERVVEKGLTAHDGKTDGQYPEGTTAKRLALLRQAARERGAEYQNETRTLGFRPTCTCYPPGEEETKPAIILDPFAGSGTTGEAATLLGRDYILIEVNPNYRKLIEKRTQGITAPLLPEAV